MITDEDLFREWQQGSAGALEALVTRYYAPLLAHLTRVTRNATQAEDLVQETFLRLVRHAATYRYPKPFRPWLYTIAHNLALNEARSAYRRHTEIGAVPDGPTTEPDPAEWVERYELRSGLLEALAHLSIAQREVLSLRFGQELTVEETAQILGIPPGTVKSRTFGALRHLRDRLEQAHAIREQLRTPRAN